MKVVDANLLLYAYDRSSARHDRARQWWEDTLSAAEPVGLPWATVLAYLRLTTHARVMAMPLTCAAACADVEGWLRRPNVSIVEPTARHWASLSRLLVDAQARANLVPDAHLAALAMERGATLYSCDQDFRRFAALAWIDPLA